MPKDPKIDSILQQARDAGYSDSDTLDRLEARGLDVSSYKGQLKTNQPVPPSKNLGQKFGTLLSEGIPDFAVGAAKGAISSLKGVNRLAEKFNLNPAEPVSRLITRKAPSEFIPEKAVTPNTPGERAGFGTEQLAEFVVPGGAITKAGKAAQVATGASRLGKAAGLLARGATEAAGAGAISAAQGGDVKSAAIAGASLPIAGKAIGLLGSGAKNAAKYISSSLSGVPEAAIEQAFRNPKTVQSAITMAAQEGGELSAQKIYQQALSALGTLRSARSKTYQQGLESIETELAKSPVKTSLIGLKSVATKTLRDFGLNTSRGTLDIGESAIQKSQVNKLQELLDRVYEWKNTNPTGVNKLRQVIRGYKIGGVNLSSSDKQYNAIISKLENNLGDYVGSKVPAIKNLNREYATQSQVIDNIIEQLKIGRGDPNTALRKLLNVFNPKSQVYRPMVQELGEKAGVDLMSDIAGLTMSQWTPQGAGKYLTGVLSGGLGVTSILNPAAYPALIGTAVASSPRFVGKVATKAGQVAPATKSIFKTIGKGVKALTTKKISDR